jgi:hypothetical protein
MIQERYGKYIRDDGDTLFKALLEVKLKRLREKRGELSEFIGGPNGIRTRPKLRRWIASQIT